MSEINSKEKKTKKRIGLKIALVAGTAIVGGTILYNKSEGFKKLVDGSVKATAKLFKKKGTKEAIEETTPTVKREYNYDGYKRRNSSDRRHYEN